MVAVAAPTPPRLERSVSPILLFNLITIVIVLVIFEIRFQHHMKGESAGATNTSSSSSLREVKVHDKLPGKIPTVPQQQQQQQHPPCDPNIIYRGPAGIPALRHRHELGALLEKRKMKHGAEVGVQNGYHARDLLGRWPSCQHFSLVDLWGYQGDHYKDPANRPQTEQDTIYVEAQKNVQPWTDQHKTTFYRMLSVEAAKQIPDNSLDFIYVDARHDYCGVLEDLKAFYPKIRPGGIISGHDFLSVAEQKQLDPNQDWSLCSDGVTVNQGAVKGAVETFALSQGLSFSVMYGTTQWTSWIMQKPTRMECVKEGEMGAYGSDIVGYQ